MKRFENKACIGIGRGFNFPLHVHILRDAEEIVFFRQYSKWEFEFPWFTVIIIDNF